MDISELKKLLKNSTSVLVMENGNPDLVIMDYQAYLKLTKSQENDSNVGRNFHEERPVNANGMVDSAGNGSFEQTSREAEILERLNREILLLKQQIQAEEEKSSATETVDLTF